MRVSSAGSWVAWVKRYLLKQVSFWDVRDTSVGSWVWRKLLKLRPLAKTFLRMDIHNGRNVKFWFDLWDPIGRMIDWRGGDPKAWNRKKCHNM